MGNGLSVAIIALIAIVVLLAAEVWLLLRLWKQNRDVRGRVAEAETRAGAAATLAVGEHGLEPGTKAPDFSLPSTAGSVVTLEDLRDRKLPILLLFTHPQCAACARLLPEAAAWQRTDAEHFTLVVISGGSMEDNVAKAAEYGMDTILVQNKREVSRAYEVPGTPGAVSLRRDGVIRTRVAVGADAVRELAESHRPQPQTLSLLGSVPAASTPPPVTPQAVPIGAPAPELRLPDLQGNERTLDEFRGAPTLLLFFSPSCSHCQRLLPAVIQAEEGLRDTGTNLLVISRGNAEENLPMGFRAPVLLEDGFTTGDAFGARGTPSAIVVDAKGEIASLLAGGTPKVTSLLDVLLGSDAPAHA